MVLDVTPHIFYSIGLVIEQVIPNKELHFLWGASWHIKLCDWEHYPAWRWNLLPKLRSEFGRKWILNISMSLVELIRPCKRTIDSEPLPLITHRTIIEIFTTLHHAHRIKFFMFLWWKYWIPPLRSVEFCIMAKHPFRSVWKIVIVVASVEIQTEVLVSNGYLTTVFRNWKSF